MRKLNKNRRDAPSSGWQAFDVLQFLMRSGILKFTILCLIYFVVEIALSPEQLVTHFNTTSIRIAVTLQIIGTFIVVGLVSAWTSTNNGRVPSIVTAIALPEALTTRSARKASTSISMCIAARARTSAARKPRCSSHSKANAAGRA